MKIERLNKQGYRRFGLVTALFIVMIFGIIFPWAAGKKLAIGWPWALAAFLSIWAIAWPLGLKIIYVPWMTLGHYVGFVNTKIILGLIYVMVFTPVAILMKLFRKDPMERKWHKHAEASYWIPSEKKTKKHMENIY